MLGSCVGCPSSNATLKNGILKMMKHYIGEVKDVVKGLEMGADDYLPKPFNPRELLARIRAVLRRFNILDSSHNQERNQCYYFADWQLNPAKRTLTDKEGTLVSLTSGEFDLLLTFVEHPQHILSRDQLLDLAKGREGLPFDRSIDVQLSRLRQKIENNPKQPELIKTVRNSGYLFTAEVKTVSCD